jgi:ribulose-phosphate 3-epimerase
MMDQNLGGGRRVHGRLIAPSILSADFGNLARDVGEAEAGGADWIHVDVMDGHFVPNITIGPAVTAAVRAATKLPVDVHLMIENPERYISSFAAAGADWITVHQEACPHLHRTVQQIREAGARPGVALNPSTPVESIRHVVADIDLLLIMTVNPGFGGQSFIPGMTSKVAEARRLVDGEGREDILLQVDGGMDARTAGGIAQAGATVFVAGSAVYGHTKGVAAAIQELRQALAV